MADSMVKAQQIFNTPESILLGQKVRKTEANTKPNEGLLWAKSKTIQALK